MNPQELRLKNIIRWQDESEDAVEVLSIELYEDTGEYHIVYRALAEGEPDGSAMLFDFEGIKLTPDWLERGGWLWNEECNSFEKYPNGDVRMNLQFREINGSYTMFNYVLKALIAERIFYVHQLQNLFFCLCGIELSFKP